MFLCRIRRATNLIDPLLRIHYGILFQPKRAEFSQFSNLWPGLGHKQWPLVQGFEEALALQLQAHLERLRFFSARRVGRGRGVSCARLGEWVKRAGRWLGQRGERG